MTPVELNHSQFGEEGPAIVILHGLLGSSRNWLSVARKLQDRYSVYTVDLRNHGASPHADSFSYAELAADLDFWVRSHLGGEPFTLVGHSLGAKVAMAYACDEEFDGPDRLVIVDASSSAAPPRWGPELAALQRIDLSTIESRAQAEAQLLEDGIRDWAFRKFLTSNLERHGHSWRWKANLPALEAALPDIFEAPISGDAKFAGPALLILGGQSSFVPDADLPKLHSHFPQLQEVTIDEAGHNVHADTPDAFLNTLQDFIGS